MMRLLNGLGVMFLAALMVLPVPRMAGAKNFAKKQDNVPAVSKIVGVNAAAMAWYGFYSGETKDPDFETIAKFITNHPDFPAMSRLREVAEQAMPGIMPDKELLEWFSANPPVTTFGMKMYAGVLIRSGQTDWAHREINNWWKKADLTPNDQSKGYMTFATYLDKSSHVERLRRLIYRGQYTNARAVAEALGNDYMALTEARIALRSGKGNADTYLARIPTSLQNDEGLMFDRLQFRRKDDNDAGAIEILNRQPDFDKMYDAEDWGKERGILARRLFEEQKYGLAYQLASNHKIKSGPGFAANEWMAGWLALEYLNKPWDAFVHFERLYHNVETPISKSRAAYWAGLSSERLGHPEIAAKWYDVAAKHSTTFYGQIASEKLGHPDKIVNVPVASSGMKNGSLAQAAEWLKANDHKPEAGMFLNKMIEISKTPQDFAAVAEVADDLSMRNFGIKAAQECEKKTGTALVGYAFPKIEKYMGDVEVEWALVHALVRQESRYDSDAVSAAGARGLMQLMPGTAQEVAKKSGMNHDTKWLTSKPAHNIALGTRYLQRLLDKYSGNYAMALAAYNAGPARVDRWVTEFGDPRSDKVDLVNWIEMIPIYETRNYVQRVLEGVYVYRQTLSQNKGKSAGGITHIAAQ